MLLAQQQVDVVLAGLATPGVDGQAAGQDDRNLGRPQHVGGVLERGQQVLDRARSSTSTHRLSLPGRSCAQTIAAGAAPLRPTRARPGSAGRSPIVARLSGSRMRASSRRAISAAISSTGCRMVVSGGRQASAATLSSNPTTAMSSGAWRPRSASAASAPSAMRSLATKRPSVSGCSAIRRRAASAPLARVKLPSTDGHVRVAVLGQRGPEADQPVLAGRHVQRARDGRRMLAAALDQPLGGQPGAGLLVDVHIAQRHGSSGPGREHGRDAQLHQLGRQRVVGVAGDEQDTVHMPLTQVAQHPRMVARVGRHHHEVDALGAQHLQRAGGDPAEERVGEEAVQEGVVEVPVGRLRDDQGDRVGPPGHQRPGGVVGHVAGRRDGFLDDLPQRRINGRNGVDDPRDRGPGHPGERGHLLDGRRPRTEAGVVAMTKTVSCQRALSGSAPDRDALPRGSAHLLVDQGQVTVIDLQSPRGCP